MIVEIIFTIIISCLIWFVIFKVLRKVEDKKLITNIEKGLEKQEKKFVTDGKEVDLIKELGLGEHKETPEENLEVPTPIEDQSPPSNMDEELPGGGLNSSGGSNLNEENKEEDKVE